MKPNFVASFEMIVDENFKTWEKLDFYPDKTKVFSIDYRKGTLQPQGTRQFAITFCPQQVTNFLIACLL